MAVSEVYFYPVSSLLLDQQNWRFRHDVVSQKAALKEQLKLNLTKLRRLAEDIATRGAVNPSEIPIVVEDHGDLIVVEGNRRLAALKLLHDPDLAEQHAAVFRQLAAGRDIPDEILCCKMESREVAMYWIELRHTGENKGVGVVPWESWQTNKLRSIPHPQTDRAKIFCEAVSAEYSDDADLQQLITKVSEGRLTTLGRLVSDPNVRRTFGFDFDNKRLIFHFPSEIMLPGIRKIFSDVADHLSVSKIKGTKEREIYIEESQSELPSRSQRIDEPYVASLSSGKTKKQTAATSAQPTTASKQTPQEEKVIFQGLGLKNTDRHIAKVLTDAQKVDINSAPAVAGIMIRVILELVVTEAGQRLNLAINERDPLQQKLRAALLHLDPNCEHKTKRNKDLEMAWLRSQDPQHGLAVQMLNAFVHNVTGAAAASEVRSFSSTFRIVLERLDTELGGKP